MSDLPFFLFCQFPTGLNSFFVFLPLPFVDITRTGHLGGNSPDIRHLEGTSGVAQVRMWYCQPSLPSAHSLSAGRIADLSLVSCWLQCCQLHISVPARVQRLDLKDVQNQEQSTHSQGIVVKAHCRRWSTEPAFTLCQLLVSICGRVAPGADKSRFCLSTLGGYVLDDREPLSR